jgi:gliding motility-associated-like protein
MLIFRRVLLGLFLLFSLQSAANHILGGNISYECLGGDQYQITLTIYKDCFGATVEPNFENLFFFPDGCTLPFSLNIPLVSAVEISDLCPTELVNSSCSGGFIPGTQQLTYSAVVTLNPGCSWEVEWFQGDWNYFINMDNSMLPTAYFSAMIDPTLGCYSSVEVTSMQVPYSCLGDAYTHQITVDNPNGYTLQYSFVCPQTLGGVNAPMFSPCNEPIPGITIDSATGEINFTTPLSYGSYNISVQIDMFDGPTFIGSMIENMAVIARICVVTPTVFDPQGIESVGDYTTQISLVEAEACAGDTLSFTVSAENSNIFRSIALTTDFLTLFPSGTFNVSGLNPAVGEFVVVTDETMIGSNLVTVTATDDACPVADTDQIQITLTVNPSLIVSALDTIVCFGTNVTFDAFGDTDFEWRPLSGPLFGQVFTGSSYTQLCEEPIQIEVLAVNAPLSCNYRDTINVATALFEIAGLVTDESCAGNDGEIDITVSGDFGGLSFDWLPNGETSEDLTGLTGDTYSVTVTESSIPGCSRDTFFVVNSVPPPSGSISGDITICEGDCTDITFTLSGVGPFTVALRDTETGLLEGVPSVIDQDVWQVCPTTTTTYTLETITDANIPACVYSIPSSITVNVRNIPTAVFLQPSAICIGEDVDIEVDLDLPGSFELTYNPSASPASPVVITDGDFITDSPIVNTTYSITNVQYTDAPFCPNTSVISTDVDVNALPTVVFAGDITICAGSPAVLDLDFTGGGDYSFIHDYAAEASPVTLSAEPYEWTVASPAGTSVITITEVADITTGCVAAVNESATITVNDLPVYSLDQDATICADEYYDLVFNVAGVGPFTVTWDDTANLNTNQFSDGDLLTVNPVGDANICITEVEDGNGCVSTVSACAFLTEIPQAFFEFSGPEPSICVGDCYDIPFIITTGSPVEFTFDTPDGQVIQTLSNGDVYSVCPTDNWFLDVLSAVDQVTDCNVDAVTSTTFNITVGEISTISGPTSVAFCEDEVCIDIPITFTNAIGPLSFDLNGVSYTNIDIATDLVGGVYTVTDCLFGGPNLTIINYVDGGTTCSAIDNADILLDPVLLPEVSFGFNQYICEGEQVDLTLAITSTSGTVDITYETEDTVSGAVVSNTIIGAVDGDIISVSPTVTTHYYAVFTEDNSAAVTCSSTVSAITEVTVNNGVQISPVDTLCANNALTYQLSFVLTGGDPGTYSVSIPGSQSLDPNGILFLSDPLDPATSVTVTVDDGANCFPFSFTIDPFTCPILTDAGTVDLTPLLLCENDIISVTANGDEILDADDVLSYVIHGNADNTLGLVYAISDVPTWDIQTDLVIPGFLEYGVEYYVSAVAGDNDGSGIVDLGASFISVSEGMPFIIYETPTASISGSAAICEDELTDLTIDFTGTGPYTFSYVIDGDPASETVVGPTVNNPETLTVGAAGLYTLLAVSNDGCSGNLFGAADVVVNPLPTVVLTGGGQLCAGSALDLTLDLTGATGWDVEISQDLDGDGLADSVTAFNAPATPFLYSVSDSTNWFVSSVVDANGCIGNDFGAIVTVNVTELPTATFAFGDSSFCAGTTVDVLIDLTGNGAWQLDYGVNGGPQNVVVNTSPYSFPVDVSSLVCLSGLTDSNGCQAAVAGCIDLTMLVLPVADAGPDLDLCSGSSIDIGTAGLPGLTYSWSPFDSLNDASLAQPTISALNTGVVALSLVLQVDVTDGTCGASDEMTVTLYPLPLVDAGEEGFICANGSTQLQGSGAVDFVWVDNGFFPSGGQNTSNPVVEPAVTTYFFVTGTDAFGCVASDSVLVNVPEPLDYAVDFSQEVCFQSCDGVADVTVSGGFEPYDLVWTDAAYSGISLVDLCAGVYNFNVTDSIGCPLSGTFTIVERPEYFIEDALIIEPACFGIESGSIEIVSATAAEYTLEGVSGGPVFAGLGEGMYDITAIDDLGCIADSTVTLTWQSAEISISTVFDELVICNGDEVNFEANAQGGFGVFTYNWYESTPPAPLFSNDNPLVVTPTDTMELSVVAIDELGCASDTLVSLVVFNTPVTVEVEQDNFVICAGECIDLVGIAGGGSGPILINWSLIDPTVEPISINATTNVCPEGNTATYQISANDGCAPEVFATVDVLINPLPQPEIITDVEFGCYPVTVILSNLNNNDDLIDCVWNLGDGSTVSLCGDIEYTYTVPGDYQPWLSVTDVNGCVNADTLDVFISAYDYPVSIFSWEPQPVTTVENEVQFINESVGASEYEWLLGAFETSIEENPFIVFPPLDLLAFDVCLISTNIYGCVDTLCANLAIQSELLVYVPNAFTPDNDGLNDIFIPSIGGGVAIEDYYFTIWDRWGDLVFESATPGEAWDGSYNDGQYYTQNDVYIWMLEVKSLETGEIVKLRGHVTLLR